MNINIRGSKVEITPAIKEYIEEKVGKIAKYFTSEDIKATVVCRVNGINQTVEVTVPATKMILRAEVTTKDLYDAIDRVSDKLERQIRKNKTRMNKKKGKDLIQEFTFTSEEETDIGSEEKIVKRKVISMKPMDEEEAILQMELIDHDFFVFRSALTDEINILYKRKDGDYGIIETK
ncbi:MAG: ribosome-associated translation inhibitor RaiA [Bacilli bacterium]|nr:ribosome-associated translation inhibitor RaiA [Bacilli bacterium]